MKSAIVSDLSARGLGVNISGIVGLEFFKCFDILFDFPKEYVHALKMMVTRALYTYC